MIRNQQNERRYAAIRKDDHEAYVRALTETQARSIKIATDIEDIIFDHFGIITVQYEIAQKRLEEDKEYQNTLIRERQEMQQEYAQAPNANAEPLTDEKAKELNDKIKKFSTELFEKQVKQDANGQKYIEAQNGNFEILLTKEKDKFFLETGYTTEQVTVHLRESQMRH